MGLRSLLGLCEHKWKPTGKLLELSIGPAQGFATKIPCGYIDVRECERCGETKGFRL